MSEKRIAAALLGGAAFLLLEVRFEHREVLGETWRGWIPLSCAALLIAVGVPAWFAWASKGRKLLMALFSLSIATGLLGAWFHSGGRPFRSAARVVSAWALPPGQDGGEKPGAAPPLLAPLAFSGLGVLGLLACAGRGSSIR
jgi:hypothetical protein